MKYADVIGARTRSPVRLVVLDEACHVVWAEQASAFNDWTFGFPSEAGHLPMWVEQHVRCATARWRGASCAEHLILVDGRVALRIFPLIGGGVRRTGVLFEAYRRRSGDVARL